MALQMLKKCNSVSARVRSELGVLSRLCTNDALCLNINPGEEDPAKSHAAVFFPPLLPMHGGCCCFVCLFFPPRSNRAPVANSDVGAVDSPVGLWCTGESRGCGAGALWADASCAASASSAVLAGRHGSKLGSESQTVGLGLRKQDRRR